MKSAKSKMMSSTRPMITASLFNDALAATLLTQEEEAIIDYIRYTGIFDELKMRRDLSLSSKPPALCRLASACEKIGKKIPEHYETIKSWSKSQSQDNIAWDGNLVCCIVYNCDGDEISPSFGTSLYHTFAVHKELFTGLE